MSAKKIVQDLYKSEALINVKVLDTFLHPDFIMEWNGLNGLIKKDRQEWLDYTKELEKAYIRFKVRISHILSNKNLVSVKYALSAKIVENPREEVYLSDFMAIWEIKEGKLYRCYQISRPAQ